MINKMLKIVNKKEYQPGYPNAKGKPATHCNEAAMEIVDTLGFDNRHFLNPGGAGWTSANDIYKNARIATLKKGLEQVTEEKAQQLANDGECVIVCAYSLTGGHGHVAVVAPETAPYKRGKGCLVVQAGQVNGVMSRGDAFDFTELTAPLFVKCRRKK